ncbi:MAG: hypothetical protein RL757_2662 [Bacteroidota bacterium]|jgi:prolipoprotein diacylglyceryltransferase
MQIHLDWTSGYYAVFYQIAFSAGLLLLLFEGFRRRYAASSWLLVCAITLAGMVLGSKIGISPLENLKMLFDTGGEVEAGQKSAIGGFLGGLLGIWIAKRVAGFRVRVGDAWAFVLPVIMIFQRVGCLLAGCCFGVCTNGDWGVRYVGESPILGRQILFGQIHEDSLTTKAIHPVQIYMILVAIFTILILLFLRKKLKGSESLVMASMACMSIGRFVTEFFRDPFTNQHLGKMVFGLQIVQWVMLFFAAVWLLLLRHRELHSSKIDDAKNAQQTPQLQRHLAVVLGFTLFIFMFKNWFSSPEKVVLHLLIGIAALTVLVKMWQQRPQISYHLMPLSIVIFAFTLMSQTHASRRPPIMILSDSTPVVKKMNPAIHNFSFAYNNNNLGTTFYPCEKVIYQGGGCASPSTPVCVQKNYEKPIGPFYNHVMGGYSYLRASKRNFRTVLGFQGGLENFYNPEQSYASNRKYFRLFMGRENQVGTGFRVGLAQGDGFNALELLDRKAEDKWVKPFLQIRVVGEETKFTAQMGASDLSGMSNGIVMGRLDIIPRDWREKTFRGFGGGVSFHEFPTNGTSNLFLSADVLLNKQHHIKPHIGYMPNIKNPLNVSLLYNYEF